MGRLGTEVTSMRRSLFVLVLSGALCGTAHAGADCVAAYSTVDSALVLCPAGDLPFVVQARIAPGVLAFRVWDILVDVTDATGLRLLPTQPHPGCSIATYSGRVYAIQDCSPFGMATYQLSGGGSGTGVSIPVDNSHDAVVLATRTTFLSPDQNGDLVVDGEDMAIVQAKLGTSDPTADFDFDGAVTPSDLAIAQQHLGHLGVADGPVPAVAGTWGRLKALFR
jgi:hypothetical protein